MDKNTKLSEIQQKRERLRKLSQAVKPLVEEGEYETINEALHNEIYLPEGHETLNTFNGWKKEGYRIKKGEKGLLFWGKPRDLSKNEEGEDEKEDTFYPISYLFSNLQVTKMERRAEA